MIEIIERIWQDTGNRSTICDNTPDSDDSGRSTRKAVMRWIQLGDEVKNLFSSNVLFLVPNEACRRDYRQQVQQIEHRQRYASMICIVKIVTEMDTSMDTSSRCGCRGSLHLLKDLCTMVHKHSLSKSEEEMTIISWNVFNWLLYVTLWCYPNVTGIPGIVW